MIEMAIVVATMMVVLATLLGILQSLTASDKRVSSLTDNQERVRFALDQLQRDLRAANPVDVASSTSAYANQIEVQLGNYPGSQYVRWRYDTTVGSPTYETLLRQLMSGPGADATVVSQNPLITRMHNVETATPVFTYLDSHGNDLIAANPSTPMNVSNCAVHIHIQVNSDATPGPQPFSENVDVELRNRLPGGVVGCAA